MEKEEEKRNAIEQAKKKAEAEIRAFQSEVHDLEARISKSEQTRMDKEHQIRMMQDEIDQQEDLITRCEHFKFHFLKILYNLTNQLGLTKKRDNCKTLDKKQQRISRWLKTRTFTWPK